MTSVNWNVVVSIQACSDYCVLQISLSFSEAMQQLLLGEVHPLLPFWFLLCIRQKWDAVHNALLMVSLWAGQTPFVFQQTKRTLCSVFQLFSCGFIGQNIFITLCTYICLIYVNIKVDEILKEILLPLQLLMTAWLGISTDGCSALYSCTDSFFLALLFFHAAN